MRKRRGDTPIRSRFWVQADGAVFATLAHASRFRYAPGHRRMACFARNGNVGHASEPSPLANKAAEYSTMKN